MYVSVLELFSQKNIIHNKKVIYEFNRIDANSARRMFELGQWSPKSYNEYLD